MIKHLVACNISPAEEGALTSNWRLENGTEICCIAAIAGEGLGTAFTYGDRPPFLSPFLSFVIFFFLRSYEDTHTMLSFSKIPVHFEQICCYVYAFYIFEHDITSY